MAAKLEQPIQPNFNRMIRLVKSKWDVDYTRDQLIELEAHIVHTLDFDLHFTSPLIFLERYQRLYNLDRITRDPEANLINQLARMFCRSVLRSKAYLGLKPSQVGAAALTLAVNVSTSPLVELLGAMPLNSGKLENLVGNNRVVCVELDDASERQVKPKQKNKCPLSMWSEDTLIHGRLSLDEDIRSSYLMVLKEVDERIFKGKLARNPSFQPSGD